MPRFTSTVFTSYHTFEHYTLNLFYCTQKPAPFTLCSERTRRPVLVAFSRTLTLLCSSTPIPQALSFVGFCNRKSLGFMHVNIRRLLLKFVLFTGLVYSANPDVLAVCESWFRKTTKNSEIIIPNYNIFRHDRTAKGGGVAIYCKDSLQSSVFTIQVCTQTIRASTFKNPPFQKQVFHSCRLL